MCLHTQYIPLLSDLVLFFHQLVVVYWGLPDQFFILPPIHLEQQDNRMLFVYCVDKFQTRSIKQFIFGLPFSIRSIFPSRDSNSLTFGSICLPYQHNSILAIVYSQCFLHQMMETSVRPHSLLLVTIH